MDFTLESTLKLTALVLHLIGWLYAIQIYLSPSPHGWTWVSVAVGTLIVALGEMFTFFILYEFDALAIGWVLPTPIAVLMIVGGPMAVTQIFKKLREDRESSRIASENGPNEQ